MKIREIFNYILGRKSSRNIARERLHRVLMQDRAAVSPRLLHLIKEDICAVISNYMVIDHESSRVSLKPGDGAATLEAVFMVKSLKRGREQA
jgi:cell division topological specificity factor MinE